jgi:hypothetical protein
VFLYVDRSDVQVESVLNPDVRCFGLAELSVHKVLPLTAKIAGIFAVPAKRLISHKDTTSGHALNFSLCAKWLAWNRPWSDADVNV